MPGVPSGRGCNACRAQKKKCDQAKPKCFRCARLRIDCIGAGQQRFKFKEQLTLAADRRKSIAQHTQQESTKFTPSHHAVQLFNIPNAPVTLLAKELVDTISPTTDIKYNLALTYGAFLHGVPQRLGNNDALDKSATALVAAHTSLRARPEPLTDVLAKYARALAALAATLDDPVKCSDPETLGAVMMLMTCQGFLGLGTSRFTGHCEGAAQILKLRMNSKPRDNFEKLLLLTLRGPVLFEGIFNPRIKFTPDEWTRLVTPEGTDMSLPVNKLLLCLAKLPGFLQPLRQARMEHRHPEPFLVLGLRTIYQTSKDELSILHTRLAVAEKEYREKGSRSPSLVTQTYNINQRVYGLAITIVIAIGCVLAGVRTEDESLVIELDGFAAEAVLLADEAAAFSPLGASLVPLSLVAAWIGTREASVRSTAEKGLQQYYDYFPYKLDQYHAEPHLMVEELEDTYRQLRLLDLEPCEDIFRHRGKFESGERQDTVKPVIRIKNERQP